MSSFAQFDATHSHGVIGMVLVDDNSASEVQAFAFLIGFDFIYLFYVFSFLLQLLEVVQLDNNIVHQKCKCLPLATMTYEMFDLYYGQRGTDLGVYCTFQL